MSDSYVFQTQEGAWRITGSTISLDPLVYAYWEGESPEAIAEDFPALTLEQIHGALAFYLFTCHFNNSPGAPSFLGREGSKKRSKSTRTWAMTWAIPLLRQRPRSLNGW